MHVFYIPIYMYWFIQGVRAGALFFFNAVNPGIKNGGIINDPKYPILEQLPSRWIPDTRLVHTREELSKLLPSITFPVILKPNMGERGVHVLKVKNKQDLLNAFREIDGGFLLQEYVEGPLEAGIFYYKLPDASSGNITSIVGKEFLHVTGDGKSTVAELMACEKRKRIYLNKVDPALLSVVPAEKEKLLLQPIGNHNKGTIFLNECHRINDDLVHVFDEIASHIQDFYFGRFDVRFESWEQLYRGELKILEVNGAKAEPAHVYQPGTSLHKAYKVFFEHWRIMRNIAELNHKRGYPYLTHRQGMEEFRKFKARQSALK